MTKHQGKIVQNRGLELSEDLKDRYSELISRLINTAQESADRDANSFLSVVQDQVLDHETKINNELEREYYQSIAAFRLDNTLEISKAKSDLVDAMVQELKLQLGKLTNKEKQEFSKQMFKRIIKKIKSQGFKVYNFTIHVWHGVKIPGCKSTLANLSVKAESSEVIIEDSIDELLLDHRNDIIRIVSRHVDENLN